MKQLSRRATLIGIAAIAGAGLAVPAGSPLTRMTPDTTSALPDPTIEVDYRVVDAMDPGVTGAGVGTNPDGGPAGNDTTTGGPRESTDTVPTAPETTTAGARAASDPQGRAPVVTTVDRDGDGRTRLLTRASTPAVPVTGTTPGESGVLDLSVRVGEVPVFVDMAATVASFENGLSESETAAGDVTPADGELDEFVVVRVVGGIATNAGVGDTSTLFEGTLADLTLGRGENGIPIPGGRPDGSIDAGATYELRVEWVFLSTPAAFSARGLAFPGDVNVAQSDELGVEFMLRARTVE